MNWKKSCRLFCRTIFWILSVIVLIGLIVFLYLGIHGVPRQYVDRLIDEIQPEGYVITAGKLRLTLVDGIVVDNLRVFEEKDKVKSMLDAKRAALFVNPFDWLQGKAGIKSHDPASVTHPLDRLSGRLTLTGVDAMGVWIEKGDAEFAIRAGKVNIAPVVVELGKDDRKGKLRGHLGYNLDSGDYAGRVEARLDPRFLTPALNSNQADMVNSFICKGPPVAIEADFSGQTATNTALWVSGLIQSSNFTYQTVPITSLESRFDYTNGIVSFNAIRLVRPEGEFTGNFKENINSSIADLDLVSTVDPTAMARLAGPEIAGYLDGVRLEGPVRIAVRGRLDHDSGALTDIQAEMEGSRLGYSLINIDRCSLKLTVKQLRIDLTDIRVELFGGTIAGKAAFYPVGVVTNFKYEVSLRGDDINLKTLVQSLDPKGDADYQGLIHAECAVSGLLDKDPTDTIAGEGLVSIKDGQLFQQNLFGGLSSMLSTFYPGMGSISITDFKTKFTIKDQKVEILDAVLSGPSFSILGEGYYAFDETIDFVVWLQPPESKTFLDSLTKISRPLLSKLLVVRLTGKVSDPKWWPLNLSADQLLALPKDLVVNMPKDVLMGLPKNLLSALPTDVLGALPKNLFINLPNELLNILKPSSKKK